MTSLVLTAIERSVDARPALDDGSLRLDYGNLKQWVAEERRWLHTMRVHRCALWADNSARWIVSDLALLAAQALNVPVPSSFTPAQVAHALDDAAIDWILSDDPHRVLIQHPQFSHVATSPRTGFALLRRPSSATPTRSVAKVTYTSGSTGTAKGVCLDVAALDTVAHSLATATATLGIEKHMCALPLPTLLENIAGVYAPLLLGAQIFVPPTASIGMSYAGLDVPKLLQAISTAAPESLILVPELLRVLVGAARSGRWRAPDSLKFIAVGGAVVSTELIEQAHAVRLPVYQGYGLSECASVVCLNTPAHDRVGSVGRPLSHAKVRIDANGEICVAGVGMTGYVGAGEDLAAEIRTGDLGEIDADGFVYVRGRARNVLITSMGRNISPEWVEGEITTEPEILQAVVAGEARPYLTALIVAAPGVSSHAIVAALSRANARLPDYARVHHWALFAEAPSLANGQLTANGRPRRTEILARHSSLIESLYASQESDIHEFS